VGLKKRARVHPNLLQIAGNGRVYPSWQLCREVEGMPPAPITFWRVKKDGSLTKMEPSSVRGKPMRPVPGRSGR
jgi:hypothetical protein